MKILCIAGSIGIAAILPILKSFAGTKKLVWGVRNKGIVNVLEEDSGCLRGLRAEVEVGVSVGKRIEVRDCIEGTEGRFLVVCCGLS